MDMAIKINIELMLSVSSVQSKTQKIESSTAWNDINKIWRFELVATTKFLVFYRNLKSICYKTYISLIHIFTSPISWNILCK